MARITWTSLVSAARCLPHDRSDASKQGIFHAEPRAQLEHILATTVLAGFGSLCLALPQLTSSLEA